MIVVAGKKKTIDPAMAEKLREQGLLRAAARAHLDQTETGLREVVLSALASGASVRVVAELAGLAPVTVSKWKADGGDAPR